MSLLSEYNNILSEQDKVMGGIAVALRSELVENTPFGNPAIWKVNQGRPKDKWIVPKDYSPGYLRDVAWTDVEKTKDGYKFTNIADYADNRLSKWDGTVGSTQNEDGIDPIIDDYRMMLQKELDRIK